MGSEDPAAVVEELHRALMGVPDPLPCPAAEQLGDVLVRVAAVAESIARIDALLDEFLPLLRAYLDPNQSGPRGAFMRRRLAKMEGDPHG